MQRNTLPRRRLAGGGWAHPYGHAPFSPFLYADGGDGDGSGSGSDDTGGIGDGGDGSGGDGGTGDGGDSGGGDTAKGAGSGKAKDGEDDAAKVKRLERELHAARSEAGKARNDAKKQAADEAVKALTQQLGKALGFVKDDDVPPDPKALAEAIAQKDTAIGEKDAALRAKDVELAVWARADKLQAKAGALLDSRAFAATLANLDPSDKNFTDALDKAIKDAVEGNKAAFAAAPPAGKSGADLSGGTREGAAKRGGSLSGAIANHYGT